MSADSAILEQQLAEAQQRIAQLERQVEALTTANIPLQQERRFQILIDHLPLMVNMFDEEGKVVIWNQSCENVLGWSREEVAAHPDILSEFYPDPAVKTLAVQTIISRDGVERTFNVRVRSGEIRVQRWQNILLPDGTGVSIGQDVTENRALIENMRQQTEQLEEAEQIARMGSWHWDLATNRTTWSTELYRILGKDPGSFEPDIDSLSDQVLPEDRHLLEANIFNSQQGNVVIPIEYRIRLEDGRVRTLHTLLRPVRDEFGGIVALAGTAQDITERKLAEEALRQTQLLNEQMSLMAKIGAWSLDLNTNELYWSPETRRIHEVAPDFRPNVAEGILFYAPEHRTLISKAVEAAMSGDPYDLELQLITAKGRRLWVRTQGKADMINGKPVRLYGTFQDIDERKRVETSLRKSQVLDEQMSQLAKIGGWQLDLVTGELVVSAETRNLYEAPPDFEMTVDTGLSLYAPEYRPMVQEALALSIQTGQPFDLEVQLITVKGKRIWVRAQARPEVVDGKVAMIYGAFQDIEERKLYEKEQQRLIRELKAALLFKDQFLSIMSHELRTPLNAIQGYTGLVLQEEGLSSDITYMLERCLANGKRLLGLINDILDISRINANRIELVPRKVEFQPLAEAWYNDFKTTAINQKLDFRLDFDPGLPTSIMADEERLTQIVANLLQNAFKFTEAGSVTLSVMKKGEAEWTISVTDTGIGISDTWHHLIFDEFRQVDSSSRRKYGGSGLGLSIVQKLCRLMGGNVSVNSQIGQGSTFTVTLPIVLTESIPA